MRPQNHDGLPQVLEPLRAKLLQVALHTSYGGLERAILILDEDPADFFDALQPLVKFIKNRKLAEPLIVNRAFVMGSLDSFPLEFLDIQSACVSLFQTEDLLGSLKFQPADLRLQMERELKSKWLLTRQAVLENPFKEDRVARVIQVSREAIHPVLKGFFALHGQIPPPDLIVAVEKAAPIAMCDLSPLIDPISGISDVYRYIGMLEKLNQRVQGWQL
jgi:hypothetical protein